LRQYIADRYSEKKGLEVEPDEILITNGSQQGLDLIGKIFVNAADHVVIERPGYLGAIQALSLYEPTFVPVPLREDGIDTEQLKKALDENQVKLFHAVLNFQNPSGITYSRQKRLELADIFKDRDTILVEDDPYGELRFAGQNLPSMKDYLRGNIVLMGSFSKIVAPGLRLGWICAASDVMEKLIVAKQASDLHSNYFAQRIVHRYLSDHDIDEHIVKIREVYRNQRNMMISSIERYFPEEVKFTRPEGGMFLWMTLPENISALRLFDLAGGEDVAFVPGGAFYVDEGGKNTLRLNFSNSDADEIDEGIRRLAQVTKELLARRK
jgi:2-aminoadipate transaminase